MQLKIVFFEINVNRHTAILYIYGSHEQKMICYSNINDDSNVFRNVIRI